MKQPIHPVICFGEVLWDILPAGAEPGGAPMNVAYHLHQQQKNPALVTCIGNDAEGEKIKNLFANRGICTDYFFVDEQHETGKVYATPDANNDMTYEIVQPVAWDFIPYSEPVAALVKEAAYFVYGSLASRSEVSRTTLLQLLPHAQKKVFDINLRPPHFTKEGLMPLLQQADILKMNEEELALVGSWFAADKDREAIIKAMSRQLNVSIIIVTLGANGALLFMNDQFFAHKGYKVKVVDTIGSGDAFLAAFITQLMKHASPPDALEYASRLGAFVASKKGGCPEYDLEEVDVVGS